MVSAADYTFDQATDSKIITGTFVSFVFDEKYTDDTGISGDFGFDHTNAPSNFTITTTNVDYNKLNLGESYKGDLIVNNGTSNITYVVEIKPTWCDNGCTTGILDLEVEIKNKGMGENDEEWYPFDDIEVEITVDNIYNDGKSDTDDDLKDIVIEWGLYNDVKGRFTDIEDEENDFNLKEGKDNKITLSFNVDPEDFSENTNEYTFYVIAYAEDSKDNLIRKSNSTVQYFEEINIIRDDFMIVTDVVIPESTQCGETVSITGEVWNIAEDTEDDVSMRIYNNELGINKLIVLGDIDELESKDFAFEYTAPSKLSEKLYTLKFSVFDEDGDIYIADTDDSSVFHKPFKIEGNCVQISEPTITATPDSEAIAGKEVIINANIENNNDEEVTYTVSVEGNEAWSDSIDPKEITVGAGESEKFRIIFNLNSDAEGDKEFIIKATAEGQTSKTSGLPLSIEKSAVGADKIVNHLKTNWFIYVIVIVNLILIIAIISVIKRMVGTTPATI